MTTSLFWLGWILVLVVVQVALTTGARRRQDGLQWASGNRDGETPQYTGVAARLSRAQANLYETFPILTGVVILAHISGHDGPLEAWGTVLYFWARLLYIPAYAYGLAPVRTLMWFFSVIALLLTFAGLL